MTEVVLYDYQLECVEAIWKAAKAQEKRILVGLPTASGKTEIFIEVLKRANVKAIVSMSSVTLAEQTARRLIDAGIDAGIYCASSGYKDTKNLVIVGTVQSLIKAEIEGVRILIVDEAHNICDEEDTYYHSLAKKFESAKLLGFTATPYRQSDGKIYGEGKFFPRLVYTKSLSWMVEHEYVVRPTLKPGEHAFDTSKLRVRAGEWAKEDVEILTSDTKRASLQVSDALLKLSGRNKIAFATSSIKHAELIYETLKGYGEKVSILHSNQKDSEQIKNKDDFEEGTNRHMVFVTMLKEGYSYRPIDGIVLLRPTRSAVLYVQICGRGLRLFEGKKNCLILDYGRVVEHLGSLDNPNMLEPRQRKTGVTADGETIKCCPSCAAYIFAPTPICESCGHEFKKPISANLTMTHADFDDSFILSPKITTGSKTFQVSKIVLGPHKSKSGNMCIKAAFYSTGIYPEVCIWLTTHVPSIRAKSMKMLRAILGSSTCDPDPDMEKYLTKTETLDFMGEKFYATAEKNSDFWKIVRIDYRAANSGLVAPF